MQLRTFVAAAVLVATPFACGASVTKQNFAKFNALPGQDKAAYCDGQVRDQAACKRYPILDQRYQDCVAAVKGHYADLPDSAARTSWLKDQGCPTRQ